MRNWEEIFSIQEVYESDVSRISDEIYYMEYDIYGEVHSDPDDYEIGKIKITANGKTGEIQMYPIYYNFENEELISNEEFFEYVIKKDMTLRKSKSDAILSARVLYEFNKEGNAKVENIKYSDNEYVKTLEFNVGNYKFDFYKSKNKEHDYNVNLNHPAARISLDIKSGVIKKWDEIFEQIRNHPNLRMDFLFEKEAG